MTQIVQTQVYRKSSKKRYKRTWYKVKNTKNNFSILYITYVPAFSKAFYCDETDYDLYFNLCNFAIYYYSSRFAAYQI